MVLIKKDSMDKKTIVFNHNRRRFTEFLKHTDQKDAANQFLEKYFSRRKSRLNILDIGTGSGEHILPFLKKIKSKKIGFRLYYLDPSRQLHKIFRDNVKKYDIQKNISGEKIMDFDRFNISKKFDVVIASQVFYYFTNWKKQIRKIINYLEKDGVALIFMKSNQSANWKIRSFFSELTKGRTPKEHYAEELIDTLKSMGIKYKKDKINSTLEITPAIKELRQLQKPDRELLSFIIRTPYDGISDEEKDALNNYLKKISVKKGNKVFIRLTDYCLIIKK
jgi:SAM-dependent methyltransferase